MEAANQLAMLHTLKEPVVVNLTVMFLALEASIISLKTSLAIISATSQIREASLMVYQPAPSHALLVNIIELTTRPATLSVLLQEFKPLTTVLLYVSFLAQ